jgi:hypothetical protein
MMDLETNLRTAVVLMLWSLAVRLPMVTVLPSRYPGLSAQIAGLKDTSFAHSLGFPRVRAKIFADLQMPRESSSPEL